MFGSNLVACSTAVLAIVASSGCHGTLRVAVGPTLTTTGKAGAQALVTLGITSATDGFHGAAVMELGGGHAGQELGPALFTSTGNDVGSIHNPGTRTRGQSSPWGWRAGYRVGLRFTRAGNALTLGGVGAALRVLGGDDERLTAIGPELRCDGLVGVGDEPIDSNVGLCALGVVFETTRRLVDEPSGRWLGGNPGRTHQARADPRPTRRFW